MFCMNCGAENKVDSVFCEQCGSRLIAGNPQIEQPQVLSETTTTALILPAQEVPMTDVTPPAPEAAGTRINRSTLILLCSLAVLAALLLITYFTLRSTVFSPMVPIRSYVNAISLGDYEQANSLVDPAVSNESRVLLTPDVAGNPEDRIRNVEVGGLNKNRMTHELTTQVGFTLNGVRQTRTLTLEPKGRTWLFFDTWTLTTPMIDEIPISVPSSMHTIDVNGVSVDLSKIGGGQEMGSAQSDSTEPDVTYSDMTQYTLPAYPGVYSVSIAESKYFTSNAISIAQPDREAVLTPEPTDELRSELIDQIGSHIDACTSSHDLTLPQGCEFAEGNLSDYSPAVTDITRGLISMPTLKTLDISTGEFSTDTIDTKITYKQRYYEDQDWQNETTSDSGIVRGTFSVENEKLTVTFVSADDYGY